jgi:CheY-like chemotaxis protein
VTAIDAFRILVLDDEAHVHDAVKQNLAQYGDGVHADFATTPDEVADLVDATFYDLALLDLYNKAEDHIGTEAMRRIDARGLSTRVMLMTHFNLQEDALSLLQLLGSPSASRLVGFLDKKTGFPKALQEQVGNEIASFRRTATRVENLDDAARQVSRQAYRYKNGRAPLRKDRQEIAAELDRLIRRLFAELPGQVERKSRLNVRLSPMARHGLSAAVVLNATVDVHFDVLDGALGGQKTVLKVGPKDDIMEEAARFSEYVRYGVKLDQRIELLGVTRADALGGLVYSFAGGSYGDDLLPLDELLRRDLQSGELDASTTVLGRLFESRHWYSVEAEPMDVGAYFEDNFNTDLGRSIHEGERSLVSLSQERSDDHPRIQLVNRGKRSYLDIRTGTRSMQIPDSTVLGWGVLMLHKTPTRLVHGDMHGGNVLVEYDRPTPGSAPECKRICLIDFRNSGPGPRCIDAVSLEASIRLAETESRWRQAMGDASRKTAAPAELATEMVDRFDAEIALYREVFLEEKTDLPKDGWYRLSETVLRGLRRAFPDVTLREYLATSLRYSFRSLGFPGQSELHRYRLAGWLAAQYALAQEMDAD